MKKKGTCEHCDTEERVLHKVGKKNMCLACKTILKMAEEANKKTPKSQIKKT